MRPHIIKTSVALFISTQFLSSPTLASEWNGSYSAEGQCYCVGVVDEGVKNTIVPTPIGGQTVSQVCQRIGAGPGLSFDSGQYNHPVYEDAQCGHGPPAAQVTSSSAAANTQCAGSLDGLGQDSASCQAIGPEWDVKAAFAKPSAAPTTSPKAEAAKPGVTVVSTKSAKEDAEAVADAVADADADAAAPQSTSLINKPVVTSVTVEQPADGEIAGKTLKATVISSASTAGRKLPKREKLEPFTGKVITIDGRRYMQARENIPTKGGEPGTRIIVDGSVYLLDNGNIEPADLYRKQAGKAKKPAKKSASNSSKKPVSQSVAKLPTQPVSKANTAREKIPLAQVKPRIPSTNGRNEIPVETKTAAVVKPIVEPVSDIETTRNPIVIVAAPKASTPIVKKPETTESQVAATNIELKNGADTSNDTQVGFLSALKLPASVEQRVDSFSYVEAMPVNYDVGGNGFAFKGSTESHSRFHYVGRAAVTNSYQEMMLGGGLYVTPYAANRVTMVLQAGVEHGSFQFDDDQDASISADYSDTGLYVSAATRLVLNHRMELRGGFGYSTFFKGDVSAFGGAYWHITRHLDFVTSFELGDNDLLGLGVRYYY